MFRIVFSSLLVLSALVVHAQLKSIIPGSSITEELHPVANLPAIHTDRVPHNTNLFTGPLPKLDRNSIEIPIAVYATDHNRLPILIKGRLKNPETNLERQAMQYLNAIAPLYKIKDPNNEWQVTNIEKDDLGITHITVKQHFNGIPIYAGTLILHTENERITKVTGRGFPSPEINTNPVISIKEAERAAISALQSRGEWKELPSSLKNRLGEAQIAAELVIYHLKENASKPKLAYHVKAIGGLHHHKSFFIDAQNGKILHERNEICSFNSSALPPDGPVTATAQDLNGITRTINTYEENGNFYLLDASRPMWSFELPDALNDPKGVIWTLNANNKYPSGESFQLNLISSENNTWSDPVAVSAHYNAGVAYEYYSTVHGRESINGQKGNIISIVNVSSEDGGNFDNAFWAFDAMWYGNGDKIFRELAAALDVAAHEMTHGVIQSEANLDYYGESGAINESFADVFAVLMDRDDYTIGEDVVLPNTIPSGALRDLSDPHNGGSTFFDGSFQPKHVDEQYFGEADNAGVHVNSGIPNHAFFLFAEAVGKETAEKVYYRALTQYLTRSSRFTDLRIAILESSIDLFDESVALAARDAFDAVGISAGTEGNYQEDLEDNPGNDYLIFSDLERSNLFIVDQNLNFVFNPASTIDPLSKPSVTDDGRIIVYVNTNRQIQALFIDWDQKEISTEIIQDQPIWRNVVISKDGNRLAAIEDGETDRIQVFDFTLSEWYSNAFGSGFVLYNPTYTQGVNAGTVKFADAMEFDPSGEILMYDALSEIAGADGQSTEYWDIGFLRVFDNQKGDWSDGIIQKLFSQLGDGVSVGNPTFSKNSPYIIAFDYLEGQEFAILGVNYETGEIRQIFENTSPGYPSYNSDDTQLIFTNEGLFWTDIGIVALNPDKISNVPNTEGILIENGFWGVAFSDGVRPLTSSTEDYTRNNSSLYIYPNPVKDFVNVGFHTETSLRVRIEIHTMEGRLQYSSFGFQNAADKIQQLPIGHLPSGTYILSVTGETDKLSAIFTKM